jgi:hypothetical protein
VSLTDAEKRAGRHFRAFAAARFVQLAEETPEADFCPPYIVWYRHDCRERNQQGTWAMFLRQHYWTSPEYWVCYCGTVEPLVLYVFPHEDCQGGKPIAEAGKFAFIYREGECPRCHLLVRSGTGRFVFAAENPPEKGAVVAEFQPDQHVPADQGAAPLAP